MINIKQLLNKILISSDVYFFTIDYLFRKIVIFAWKYILEFSLVDKWWSIKQSKYFYFFLRKIDDIDNIYNFLNSDNKVISNKNIWEIINIIIKNEELIYHIFYGECEVFYEKIFNKIKINKNILFILKWWWMEETIEKSFISYCNNSNIKLTVLYKFWTWYWGQKLNQDWFFNELKVNNKNVKFLYNEDFNDEFIDSMVNENTEIFSFQYDYKWIYKDFNMIVLSSVTDKNIDCSRYKNVFSCYQSKTIWYSTDKFINIENTKVYKIFNPQNIDLLNNYSVIKKVPNFILSWWMSWARDFSILNSLEGKYKWILVSDEIHEVKNFLSMYRWIQSYYWFLGVFKLSSFWVFCHLEKFNDDDRSKMIATSICAWKPVIVPHNDWLIVKEIIDNKLGLVYRNWDIEDLQKKVMFFAENKDNIEEYSKRCLSYSKEQMDINNFINFIFDKAFIDE